MKVLVLCEYPPVPGGLSTQAELLVRGLREIGVETQAVDLDSGPEKEWYYRWFRPEVVVGIGYWGHTPQLVLHPQRHGMTPAPWLVADGYIANYRQTLNALPLILVTSRWVKEVYVRDGINPELIEVLPVGCDTDAFLPRPHGDPKVRAVRQSLGLAPEDVMVLTIGGDAASKGGQEMMQALASIDGAVPRWRYVCKVWPQPRTVEQNRVDQQLARDLGLDGRVTFATDRSSRDYMPYLISACDIYAGPSRLEGFGMPQVEAGACARPVVGIRAMAMLDTLLHGETALLAGAKENCITEAVLGKEAGFSAGQRIVFDPPRVADYRAEVSDLAEHLLTLMRDPDLRRRMGEAGRRWVVERFDYRAVARRFVEIVTRRLSRAEGTETRERTRAA